MKVAGEYFDARSSRAVSAELEFLADRRLCLRWQDAAGAAQERALELTEVEISERLGNIARRVTTRLGEVFETNDNDAIDRGLALWGQRTSRIHQLEQHWPLAVGSLAAIAVLSFLFVRFGLPALASYAARTLPASVDRALGAQTLQILDKVLLKPTELPAPRQRELQRQFRDMTAALRDGHQYRLEMRHSSKVGPNAFALPSGIVVMTDELVALAEHDDELLAVLAHEVGHVRGRHALRRLLQSAGISALAFAILGDVTSVSALAGAIPAMIEAKHSRDFEREADSFAKAWLTQRGIPSSRFDDILCRLEREANSDATSPAQPDKSTPKKSDSAESGRTPMDFWSTHPPTDERARCR